MGHERPEPAAPRLRSEFRRSTCESDFSVGPAIGDMTFKVHLDGYNQLPYLTGEAEESARNEFACFNDDGKLVAFRYGDWKGVFCEMVPPGGFEVWYEPFNCLRIPKLFNLRMDPYERADIVSDQYDDWRGKNAYLMGWMVWHAADFLETFVDYPPSQPPASFTIDQVEADVVAKIRAQAEAMGSPPDPANPTGN